MIVKLSDGSVCSRGYEEYFAMVGTDEVLRPSICIDEAAYSNYFIKS